MGKLFFLHALLFSVSIFASVKPVTIAIIDTGIDLSNPELKELLWTNPLEIPNNDIDDDENGFVDDIHGWNFADHNSNLSDIHGHGTHIAGIIKHAKVPIQLMILKYYSEGSKNLIKDSTDSLKYAVKMGAQIINYSGGGNGASAAEARALREAEQKNILVIAAAGNSAHDLDRQPFFPASYPFRNIISVTALDEYNQLLKSSNFGRDGVDIAAPGKNIYSSLPGKSFGPMSGTSQATAFVTKVVSQLISQKPTNSSYSAIIEDLKHSAIKDPTLKTSWGLRLGGD